MAVAGVRYRPVGEQADLDLVPGAVVGGVADVQQTAGQLGRLGAATEHRAAGLQRGQPGLLRDLGQVTFVEGRPVAEDLHVDLLGDVLKHAGVQ